MSKLLLTSAGLITPQISRVLIDEFSGSIYTVRALVVAYAKNSIEESYVQQSKQELIGVGFQNVEIANMHYQVELENLGDFGVIYVCGGNTFSILDKLRETELDSYIINQINKGTIYVGVSAGSIIAGPNIEIAGWGSEGDKNEIELNDLHGCNLTDIMIFPHFHEGLKDEVEEFKKKTNYEVIPITNEQAVFVKNGIVKIVG